MQKNRKRKTNRQRAWEYMRRNRFFSIEDILLILEMNEDSLKLFCRQLLNAGYIVRVNRKKAFKARTYKLIRNTGAIAPQWLTTQARLYDKNLKEVQIRDASMKLPIEDKSNSTCSPIDNIKYAEGRILKILEGNKNAINAASLMERSGVPQGDFKLALEALEANGSIVADKGKFYIKETNGRATVEDQGIS